MIQLSAIIHTQVPDIHDKWSNLLDIGTIIQGEEIMHNAHAFYCDIPHILNMCGFYVHHYLL